MSEAADTSLQSQTMCRWASIIKEDYRWYFRAFHKSISVKMQRSSKLWGVAAFAVILFMSSAGGTSRDPAASKNGESRRRSLLQLPDNIPGFESPPSDGIGLPNAPTIPSFDFPPLGFMPPSLGGLNPPSLPFTPTTTPLSPLIPLPPFSSSNSALQLATPEHN